MFCGFFLLFLLHRKPTRSLLKPCIRTDIISIWSQAEEAFRGFCEAFFDDVHPRVTDAGTIPSRHVASDVTTKDDNGKQRK